MCGNRCSQEICDGVCVLMGLAHQKPASEVRRFGTSVPELERLRAWLLEKGCTDVVMESTGSYWKPVFNILERDLKVILANAEKVKALRGKKTDPNDSRWLAGLLRHGLVQPSFIPPRDIRELRDLTRRRRTLMQQGASERNRVQKVLGRRQRENRQCINGRVRYVWTSDAGGFTGQRHDC
jgi:transposase